MTSEIPGARQYPSSRPRRWATGAATPRLCPAGIPCQPWPLSVIDGPSPTLGTDLHRFGRRNGRSDVWKCAGRRGADRCSAGQPACQGGLRRSHSVAMVENIAESRSSLSSPGACDRDHWRKTPSNRAPNPWMARRDRSSRASVLRSTRTGPRVSNAYSQSRNFASTLIPVRCAAAASQVQPISTAQLAGVRPEPWIPVRRRDTDGPAVTLANLGERNQRSVPHSLEVCGEVVVAFVRGTWVKVYAPRSSSAAIARAGACLVDSGSSRTRDPVGTGIRAIAFMNLLIAPGIGTLRKDAGCRTAVESGPSDPLDDCEADSNHAKPQSSTTPIVCSTSETSSCDAPMSEKCRRSA